MFRFWKDGNDQRREIAEREERHRLVAIEREMDLRNSAIVSQQHITASRIADACGKKNSDKEAFSIDLNFSISANCAIIRGKIETFSAVRKNGIYSKTFLEKLKEPLRKILSAIQEKTYFDSMFYSELALEEQEKIEHEQIILITEALED